MSDVPKIQRLVMFKHGVAFLERSGRATGNFELSFKRREMNDVLKTLAVWVASGAGRVASVAFEAPDDPAEALEERNLVFEPGEIGLGLLHSLRGRRVGVSDGEDLIRGDVIGVQETPGGHGPPQRQLLLRTGAERVQVFDLSRMQSLQLIEAPSRADLEFVLDRSRAASSGANRSVHVQLDGRAEDLRVAYVIPAPVWRVSYRLIMEGEASVLMAWAVVHNPADEDLEAVDLTLTTGQPVSFVIDLYEAKHVERTRVEEQSRAAAAPRAIERSYAPQPSAAVEEMGSVLEEDEDEALPLRRSASARGGPPAPAPAGGAAKMMTFGMLEGMAEATEGGAQGEDRGEFFEYKVSGGVSIKRGGSALVPLSTAKVRDRKQRLWRDGCGPSPDLVVEFDNDTGLVLEEGPVVVYDQGNYAGESMLPYSCRGVVVRLAFAKDLAVRCRRRSVAGREVVSVSLGEDALVEEHRQHIEHVVYAESDHGESVEVIVELPKRTAREIDPEGPQPFEQTASTWRFRLELSARGRTELKVREVWKTGQRIQYQHLSASQLDQWLEGRHLDRKAFDELSGVLEAWSQAGLLENRAKQLERGQQGAYQKQSKISEQLAVLKERGEEGRLRLRYVEQLGTEHDKINALEAEVRQLRERAEQLRDKARRRLSALSPG